MLRCLQPLLTLLSANQLERRISKSCEQAYCSTVFDHNDSKDTGLQDTDFIHQVMSLICATHSSIPLPRSPLRLYVDIQHFTKSTTK
jgi:hypothetical protein